MKQLTDEQLKQAKSILDLTDDIELIRKVYDMDDLERSWIEEGWTDLAKIESMVMYAEYIGDRDLQNRIEKLYEYELTVGME